MRTRTGKPGLSVRVVLRGEERSVAPGLTIAALLVDAVVLAPGLRCILDGFTLARTQVVECRRAAGGVLPSALLAPSLARLAAPLLLPRLLTTLLLLSRLLTTLLLLSRLLAATLLARLLGTLSASPLLLPGLHTALLLSRLHVAGLLLAALGGFAARGIHAEVVHVIVVARPFDAMSFVFTHTSLLV